MVIVFRVMPPKEVIRVLGIVHIFDYQILISSSELLVSGSSIQLGILCFSFSANIITMVQIFGAVRSRCRFPFSLFVFGWSFSISGGLKVKFAHISMFCYFLGKFAHATMFCNFLAMPEAFFFIFLRGGYAHKEFWYTSRQCNELTEHIAFGLQEISRETFLLLPWANANPIS